MSQKPAHLTRYPSPDPASTLRQNSTTKQPPSRPPGPPVKDRRPADMSRTNLLDAFDAEASSFNPISFSDTGGKPKRRLRRKHTKKNRRKRRRKTRFKKQYR